MVAPALVLLAVSCALPAGASNTWSTANWTQAASPNSTARWETIPGLTLTLASDDDAHDYLVSYSLGVQAFQAGDGSQVTSRGILQARLVVDGVAFREGSTHAQAVLRNTAPAYATTIAGFLHVTLRRNKTHVISVQWKASTDDIKWRSDPGIGDGFVSGRALSATRYRYAWSHVASSAATYSRGTDWARMPDSSLTFTMRAPENVQLSYCVTVHAEGSTSPWEAQDELLLRLVVDGDSFQESVAVFAKRENRVLATSTMFRSLVLALGTGTHRVDLEWKKSLLSSTVVFRSDPFTLDGFASSRALFAIADQHGIDAVEHLQTITIHPTLQAAPRPWATVTSERFEVENTATVIVEYALPVISTNLTDFDSWTYDQLSAISARLLIDGAAYREDGSLLAGYTRSRSELHGRASVRLAQGSHTATLQWHAASDGAEGMWKVLAGFGGLGIGRGFSLITLTEVYDQQPKLVFPAEISHVLVQEDEMATFAGIRVSGIGSHVFLDLSVWALHGNISFDQTQSNRTGSAIGEAQEVNRALDRIYYFPDVNYCGNETILFHVRAESKTDDANFSFKVAPVNDPVVISAPASLVLTQHAASISLRGVAASDPDARFGQQRYALPPWLSVATLH